MLEQRQAGPHARPTFQHACNLARSTQLLGAFAQGEQSYPGAMPLRQPDAIVDDLYLQHFLLAREANTTPASMGVACHIGQSLLHDAVGGDLDGGRKLWQGIRLYHPYMQPLRS